MKKYDRLKSIIKKLKFGESVFDEGSDFELYLEFLKEFEGKHFHGCTSCHMEAI